MEEEGEEVSSPSDPSDSSDEFTCDRQSESESESYDSDNGNDVDEGDEPSTVRRAPSKDDRKSQNVAALVTYVLISIQFDLYHFTTVL